MMRAYELRRVELTTAEYADLAIKDHGAVYVVDGVVVGIGGLPIKSSATTGSSIVAAFGHSMVANGWFGQGPTAAAAVGSIGGVNLNSAAGYASAAGTYTLAYNAADRTLTWNGGPATPIRRGGPLLVQGPTIDTGIYLAIRRISLPAVNASMTITVTAGTLQGRSMQSPYVHASMRLSQSVRFHNYGASGATMQDTAETIAAVLSRKRYPLVTIHGVTNSIVFGDSAAQTVADSVIAIEAAKSAGSAVIFIQEIPIRAAFTTSAQRQAVQYVNAQIAALYASDTQVKVANLWDCVISPVAGATTFRANFSVGDETHPSGLAAQVAGYKLADLIAQMMGTTTPAFGLPSQGYDATTNPFGNLLGTSYLTGDNSGLANGLVKTDQGGVTATASKVARADGFVDAQRLAIASTTAGSGSVLQMGPAYAGAGATTLTCAAPPDGTICRAYAEYWQSGNLITPDLRIVMQDGSNATVATVRACIPDTTAAALPIATHSGVMETMQFRWRAGATKAGAWLAGYTINGTTASTVDFGRVMLQPVPLDEVFDEHDWMSSLGI